MQNEKKNEFFELLLLNSSEELNSWLIAKGKSAKAVAPVMFIDKSEMLKENEK